MGLLQQYAATLGLDLTNATHAIEAYALGVVLGGPVVTILAARLNRHHLLLALMALFVLGNVLSAVAGSLGTFALARFLNGIPQGAYFGAGAVVASYLVGRARAGVCPGDDGPDHGDHRRLAAGHLRARRHCWTAPRCVASWALT